MARLCQGRSHIIGRVNFFTSTVIALAKAIGLILTRLLYYVNQAVENGFVRSARQDEGCGAATGT